jgi:hypothetical protein
MALRSLRQNPLMRPEAIVLTSSITWSQSTISASRSGW